MNDFASLPYRPCVGVMLVNSEGLVFVGKRVDAQLAPDSEGDAWQMPQGGIDDGEDIRTAALRELWEETGVREQHVTLIAQTEKELLYDLPDHLMGKLWGGRFRGQRQHWVLGRFTGSDADVDLNVHVPAEFHTWKWVNADELPQLIVPFKKRVYRAVVEEFRALI